MISTLPVSGEGHPHAHRPGEGGPRSKRERAGFGTAAAAVGALAFLAAALGIGVDATRGGRAAVDEPQYLLTALSLAEDRDLDIADELAERRWRAYFHAELPVQTAVLPGGRQISPHDPLLPLLLAVPVGLGGWVAAKFALAAMAGLTAAAVLWLAVRRFSVPLPLAASGTAVGFASAPFAVYGQQVYPELPAALAVTVAAGALTGPLRRGGQLSLAAAVVALPWLGVKYAPVGAAFALVGLAVLIRRGRRRAAAALAGGLAAAGAAYLVAHRVLWGGWTVYATGDHFQSTGEFSVVGVDPDYAGRALRLVALLVDRAYGLAAWQPAWLLLVPALAALLHRRPRDWVALAVPLAAGWLVATFVALTMHGFWWPGRQVVVVLPLALVAVLWWLAAAPRVVRLTALALGLAGVAAYAALLLDGWAGRITWVTHFEGTGFAPYRLWRLLLPDYREAWAVFWPLHLAWIAGFAALAVLVHRHGRRGARVAAGGDPHQLTSSPIAERIVR